MANCPAEHTKFQPTDEQWRCPECGASFNHFYIVDNDEDVSVDCDLLHKKDEVVCSDCNYEASGQKTSLALLKKSKRVPCECCKGTGFVTRKG